MRATITEVALRAAEPPERGAKTLWDGSLKHFGVRISQGGTKSFIVLLGSGCRQVIGRYPIISLADARAEAKRILARRTLEKFQPQTIPWDEAVKLYLAACEHKNRPRTVEWYRYLLALFVFEHRSLSDITPQELQRVIDKLANRQALQNAALVALKAFFHWAERRHYVDRSPCARMQRPKRIQSRSRTLSDDELRRVWIASEQCGTFGAIVKLLILTGQRRGEIAALRNEWICDGAIKLPNDITKNGREHAFPLLALSSSVIQPVRDIDSPQSFLFPARGQSSRPFTGWSKSKAALDKLSGVAGWTLHDLRRTFATNLAALGTPIHVTERLLNHVSGSQAGIVGVYQRHTYAKDCREAVERWEAHLTTLLEAVDSAQKAA